MTYYTREKILKVGEYKKIKLNKTENKLLICLSSNNVISHKEIENYTKIINVSRLITDFKRKTGLKIKTRIGNGYILEDEIYFE